MNYSEFNDENTKTKDDEKLNKNNSKTFKKRNDFLSTISFYDIFK